MLNALINICNRHLTAKLNRTNQQIDQTDLFINKYNILQSQVISHQHSYRVSLNNTANVHNNLFLSDSFMYEILNSLAASISERKKQVYTLPFPPKLLNEYLHSIPNTERDSPINYRLKFDCHSLWKKKKKHLYCIYNIPSIDRDLLCNSSYHLKKKTLYFLL